MSRKRLFPHFHRKRGTGLRDRFTLRGVIARASERAHLGAAQGPNQRSSSSNCTARECCSASHSKTTCACLLLTGNDENRSATHLPGATLPSVSAPHLTTRDVVPVPPRTRRSPCGKLRISLPRLLRVCRRRRPSDIRPYAWLSRQPRKRNSVSGFAFHGSRLSVFSVFLFRFKPSSSRTWSSVTATSRTERGTSQIFG